MGVLRPNNAIRPKLSIVHVEQTDIQQDMHRILDIGALLAVEFRLQGSV